jgi:hypothetical protein
MTKTMQISKEEMEPIVAARSKVLEAAGVAEKALKDARLAELEFKVQIQQLYLAKGLDPNCKVEITTGTVTWPEEPQETPAEDLGPAAQIAPQRKKRGRKAILEENKKDISEDVVKKYEKDHSGEVE